MLRKNRGRPTENDRSLKEIFGAQTDQAQRLGQRLGVLESSAGGRSRLYVLTTQKIIQMSSTEQEYASIIIQRGMLGTTSVLSILSELFVYNVSAATNNIILRTRYGSGVSTINSIAIAPLATQVDFRVLRLLTKITADGVDNRQRILHTLRLSGIAGTIATTNLIEAELPGSMAVNSSVDQLLQLTVQHSDATVLFKTVRNLVEFGFPISAA